MAFSLDFRAHSEVGRVRKNNQDGGYASPNLLLVADGMGGAAAGDVASAVAVHLAVRADRRLPTDELLPHLSDVARDANTRLAEMVAADPLLDGMGTTLCAGMFSGTHLGIAHIGDSRCYRLRYGHLRQLTHDHSWVQSLIDEGRLTPGQAAVHPHRSLILKVLNGQASMDPDLELFEVRKGDRFLFCSDGLSGMIDDERIASLLGLASLDDAVARLAAAANEGGGHDNITVVIGEVVPQSDALDMMPAATVGSALEHDFPEPPPGPGPGAASAQSPDQPPPSDPQPDAKADEDARYAPKPGTHRRWPGVVGWVVAVALVLGGATWGVLAYAQTRYFVAEADGAVAIYHGMPGSLLGLQLNELVEKPGIKVADLPRFHQRLVENTIASASLEDARLTTEKLRAIAEKCVASREERLNPPQATPAPTALPSGLSTVQPDYPTYLAPLTPSATEEADPEAC